MDKQHILNEIQTSSWQPKFEFTDDLDAVVDSILKPHEDYFLGLHSKVKEIIERETKNYIEDRVWFSHFNNGEEYIEYRITFADVCNWQKELFEHKKKLIQNQHINLGLRTNNVKVRNWIPPHPMFLEDLKEMCFPILLNQTYSKNYYFMSDFSLGKDDELIKYSLTQWYKIFETIHYFSDLNGRLGGIIINIISYILTGKYLIKI